MEVCWFVFLFFWMCMQDFNNSPLIFFAHCYVLQMPLALEFISSAVAMRLLLTSACFVCCVVTMSLPPGAESRLGTAIEESGSTLEALLNVEWSNDDLEALQNIMDEQVEIFRAQLLEHFENSAVHRGKRGMLFSCWTLSDCLDCSKLLLV